MNQENSSISDPEILNLLKFEYILILVILITCPIFVTYGWDETHGPDSAFLLVQFPWYPFITGEMIIYTRGIVMMVAYPIGAAISILDAIWIGIHLALIKKKKIKKVSLMRFTLLHLIGNAVALFLGTLSNYFGLSAAGGLILVFSSFGYMLARQKEREAEKPE
ncbi:MAG: hypothetical protein ACFFCS_17905 [Candidatus Hodarchaeota archaeon]